jgi:hypothetical protein
MENTAAQGRIPASPKSAEVSLALSDFLESEMDDVRDYAGSDSFAQLNDSEAGNIAFILSDRFSRNSDWNLSLDMQGGEPQMAEIASKVSKRLEELSLRLGDDHDANRLENDGL